MTKLKFNPLTGEFDYVSTVSDFSSDFFPSSLGSALWDWFEASSSTISENLGASSSGQAWSGAAEFYAVSSIAFKSGVAEINMLTDVDTQSTSPTRDYVLKWNGNAWVPALYNATFVFSILSFSDGEATTQLIGSGVWKAQSAMSYTATYTNGPPDEAWVQYSNNGGAYTKIATMVGPTYAAGTNDIAAINYPSAKDQYHRFRLSANCDTDTDSELETSIYFRNYVKYGVTTESSGWDSADIAALAGGGVTPTSTYTSSYAIDASAGANYILFAHPSSYTSLHISGMIFNTVICPFEAPATVSVTNSAGYTENYKVYRSTLTGLGNSTLTTSTSDSRINKIYYGGSTKTSTYTESDVEGLDIASTATNDQTQVWTAVTLDAGEYFIFAIPSRLTTPTFWDYSTGFGASFESPETVAVTNVNGQTENYKVFRSTNILGPGSFQLETK